MLLCSGAHIIYGEARAFFYYQQIQYGFHYLLLERERESERETDTRTQINSSTTVWLVDSDALVRSLYYVH